MPGIFAKGGLLIKGRIWDYYLDWPSFWDLDLLWEGCLGRFFKIGPFGWKQEGYSIIKPKGGSGLKNFLGGSFGEAWEDQGFMFRLCL